MNELLKLSDCKKIKAFCEELHSQPEWKEVAEKISDGESDFTVDNVRFIDSESIDSILADELSCDEYVLGSFKAWAIADATGWPLCLIEACQKAGGYAEIGSAMEREHIEKLAKFYSDNDGYGPNFNGYDGSEGELKIGEKTYHVFDNR